jgi:glycosyltransferase involved in cell wall biosynthesis
MADETNRIRVLMVAPSLDILGGQAIQARRLLDLLACEPSIEIEFLPVNPRLPGLLRPLQKIKYVRTVVTLTAYCFNLVRRTPRCDVLHIFSASYWSFVLAPTPALIAARLFGKPSILNYRSGEAEDHLQRWASARRALRLAHVILVPSQYLVGVFGRFGFPARSIANTIPIGQIRFRERNPLRPVFLSNRNFHPMYNVGNTLRAFATIQQRFPEAALIVAGDGQQADELRALAAHLKLRNVNFTGAVEPARMPDLYDAADVYLNSSEIDNMPTSLIEAFAAGLPVISTDAGGIPYIVEHERTGILVQPRQPDQMAAAAIRLLEDQVFAQRIIAAALGESAKYRWETLRKSWLELYLEIAAAGGR